MWGQPNHQVVHPHAGEVIGVSYLPSAYHFTELYSIHRSDAMLSLNHSKLSLLKKIYHE